MIGKDRTLEKLSAARHDVIPLEFLTRPSLCYWRNDFRRSCIIALLLAYVINWQWQGPQVEKARTRISEIADARWRRPVLPSLMPTLASKHASASLQFVNANREIDPK